MTAGLVSPQTSSTFDSPMFFTCFHRKQPRFLATVEVTNCCMHTVQEKALCLLALQRIFGEGFVAFQ